MRDLRLFIVEVGRSIRVPNDDGHFRVAFVGSVANPNKATTILNRIKKIKIHRFVKVRLGAEFMGVIIFRLNIAYNTDHMKLLNRVIKYD